MKQILHALLILLIGLPLNGQQRLHRLGDPEQYDNSVSGSPATTKQAFLDNLAGFQTFSSITDLQSASPSIGFIVEDRSTGNRYQIRSDSTSYALPIGGGKYAEQIRSTFQVLDSTDIALEIDNYRIGDRIAIRSGANFQVVKDDTTGYKINDSLYLKRENPRLNFRDIADMKANSKLIENNSIVSLANGARYLVSTAPPGYLASNGIFVNFTEDSTTCFSMPTDLPSGNLLTHSDNILSNNSTGYNMIGKFATRSGYPDPFGGNKAVKVTHLSGAANTLFNKAVSFVNGVTYTFGFWAKRGEGAANTDYTIEAEIRDAGYQDIGLPAAGWTYHVATATAVGTSNRLNINIIGIDPDDFFYLYGFQVLEGTKIPAYINTGKRSQPLNDQLYYAYLLPDSYGKVHHTWFSNVEGGDWARSTAAKDYCTSNPNCTGVIIDEDLRWEGADFQTITFDGPGCVFEGVSEGLTEDDIRYTITVDLNDDTKDILHFTPGTNSNGVGLRKIRMKVISECHSAIKITETFKGVWERLYIDGLNDDNSLNITNLIEAEGSTIWNTFHIFEFSGADTAANLSGNSWRFVDGRFYGNKTSIKGSAHLYHVAFENYGLPAVITEGAFTAYNLRGEGAGKLFYEQGISVDSLGGPKPIFHLVAATDGKPADVKIYGFDGISGFKDDNQDFYAELLDLEDGSFKMFGGDYQTFATPNIRSSGGASILFVGVRMWAYGARYDGLHDPDILQTIECEPFNLSQANAAQVETVLKRAELNQSEFNSSIINKAGVASINVLDTLNLANIILRSSANNWIRRTPLQLSTWSTNGFTVTNDYSASLDGDSTALLINDGTDNPDPNLRYNITSDITAGRYIFSFHLKNYATSSLESVEILELGSTALGSNVFTIDQQDTYNQVISIVTDFTGDADTRFDLFFNGSTTGDSMELSDFVLFKVDPDQFKLGPTSIRPGAVYADNAIVTGTNDIKTSFAGLLTLGGNVDITGTLTAQQYRQFHPLTYNAVDTLPIERLEEGYQALFISDELDSLNIQTITFGTTRNVTADTQVRLSYYDISAASYTSFGAATITNGSNQATVTGLGQLVEQGDWIFAEVVTSGGETNGLSVSLRLQ